MSADLMLVSRSRGENFEGKSEKCVCVDETSMGSPHTEFGSLMAANSYREIDDAFIDRVKHWYENIEHKDYINIEKVVSWLEEHKGESFETECW